MIKEQDELDKVFFSRPRTPHLNSYDRQCLHRASIIKKDEEYKHLVNFLSKVTVIPKHVAIYND